MLQLEALFHGIYRKWIDVYISGVEPVSCYRKVTGSISLVCSVLRQDTEPPTAPDVLVGTLHGSHHHQCMNICMNYNYNPFGQKRLLKRPKCKCICLAVYQAINMTSINKLCVYRQQARRYKGNINDLKQMRVHLLDEAVLKVPLCRTISF